MVIMMMMTSGLVWIEHDIGTLPENTTSAGRGRGQHGPRDPAGRLMDRGREEPVEISCLGPSVPGQRLTSLEVTSIPTCQPSSSIGVALASHVLGGGQGEIEKWRMSSGRLGPRFAVKTMP